MRRSALPPSNVGLYRCWPNIIPVQISGVGVVPEPVPSRELHMQLLGNTHFHASSGMTGQASARRWEILFFFFCFLSCMTCVTLAHVPVGECILID